MNLRLRSIALAVMLAVAGGAYGGPASAQPDKRGACGAQEPKAGSKLFRQRKGCGKGTHGLLAGKAGTSALLVSRPARKGNGAAAVGATRQGVPRAGKRQRRTGPFASGSRSGGFRSPRTAHGAAASDARVGSR